MAIAENHPLAEGGVGYKLGVMLESCQFFLHRVMGYSGRSALRRRDTKNRKQAGSDNLPEGVSSESKFNGRE